MVLRHMLFRMRRIATLFALLLVSLSAVARTRAVRSVRVDWMPPACAETDLPYLRFVEPNGTVHLSKGDPSVTKRPAPDTIALALGAPVNVLWAVDADGGIHRSEDAGCTWSVVAAVPEALTYRNPVGIAARNAERVYVYMGGRPEPLTTWIVRITGATIEKLQIPDTQGFLSLEVDLADSLHVRAIGRMGNSWESRDGGATWTSHGQIVPFLAEVKDVAFDPRDFDHILAATTGGVRESRDGGRTWSSRLARTDVTEVAFAPSDPRVIYTGIAPRGVQRSMDGGETFADVSTSVTRLLAVHPRDPQTWASPGATGFAVTITRPGGTVTTFRFERAAQVVWAPSGILYYIEQLVHSL
jgi:hypothetical protein